MAKKTGKGNTEFDLGPADTDEAADLGLNLGPIEQFGFDEPEEEKKEEFVPKVDVKLDVETPEPDPKANYVKIFIDEVEGMPNYEVVGHNGKIFRIKRGEEVAVPPEVIYVLKDTIATRIVQKKDPVTGQMIEERRNYSAIPWRKV